MKHQIISVFLGIVLLSSVASFSPIPVDATHIDYEKETNMDTVSEGWDKDSDNDGWSDNVDHCPFERGDADGILEGRDGCPGLRSGSLDTNDDGLLDSNDFDLPVDEIDVSDIADFVFQFGDAFYEIWEELLQSVERMIGWR